MQKFTDVIMEFVNKMGYLSSKDIEGIIFYGSNQTGFGNQFSDIDLHIIFNNNLEEEIRGSALINGIRIEYFEKKLESMYSKTLNEFKNQGNAVVSMIVYGDIILDKNGKIKTLQDYIKAIHSLPMPCLSEEEAKEQLAIINNFFDDLKNLIEQNDIYANHAYHLALERIKDFYFSYYGLPGVSRTKALKTMLNDDYRHAIKKENPPAEFIELYLSCLDENQTLPNKLISLERLYNYSTREIDFDKYNHRIVLSKKR